MLIPAFQTASENIRVELIKLVVKVSLNSNVLNNGCESSAPRVRLIRGYSKSHLDLRNDNGHWLKTSLNLSIKVYSMTIDGLDGFDSRRYCNHSAKSHNESIHRSFAGDVTDAAVGSLSFY
jgi:hypothetical protein